MTPEQIKIVKRVLVRVAADFERHNGYYRHGLYSVTDQHVDDLHAALLTVGVVWTFGKQPEQKAKRK